MDVILEFTLESVENEEHLSRHIAEVVSIVDETGLEHTVGGAGTTILGPLNEVLDCVAQCHEALGEEAQRIKTTLTLDVNENWPPGSIQLQAEKVRKQLAESPTA